jgi:hypothetical protein
MLLGFHCLGSAMACSTQIRCEDWDLRAAFHAVISPGVAWLPGFGQLAVEESLDCLGEGFRSGDPGVVSPRQHDAGPAREDPG